MHVCRRQAVDPPSSSDDLLIRPSARGPLAEMHGHLRPWAGTMQPEAMTDTDPFTLAPARVHEAMGRNRRAFALFQAARHPGRLVWVLPAHASELPLPQGLPDGIATRLHLVRITNETDLLWSVEEALRSQPISLVIAEPGKPLSLTAGRRLQLAAEAGQTTGLMLIREGAGSNAAETRWNCTAIAGDQPDSTLHQWEIIKNKSGTLRNWTVHWDGTTAAFDLVSKAGQRCQPQETPL